jgi:hypothetical protein
MIEEIKGLEPELEFQPLRTLVVFMALKSTLT